MIKKTTDSIMMMGEAASSGVGRGLAFVCRCAMHTDVPVRKIETQEVSTELEKLDLAILEVEKDLLSLQQNIRQTLGAQEAAILEMHIELLHDPLLRKEIEDLCQTEKVNVETALVMAIDKIVAMFVRMENLYMRERGGDMRDIGKRLGDHLNKKGAPKSPDFPQGSIIVTEELLPSIFAQLDRKKIHGVIIEKGGQTAHATILARAAGIPLLIRVADATDKIRTGELTIVDGLAGRIFVNPEQDVIREYDQLEMDLQKRQTALSSLIHLPTVTSDDMAIKLCANVGKVADAMGAAEVNADGVGLYRTEFVFLVQDQFPSEEEQYQMYLKTADFIKPRETVIRVLDIGSDKRLPYLPLPIEANPSLGCRGTRLLLAHPEILHTQLRAILRLSATHPVSILFPMIGGVEDIRAARLAIEKAKSSLSANGHPFNPAIRIGAMIESPAAAIMIRQLSDEVDYFSIGSNDLVQYLLTTDRTSSEMASYYEPLHPAVLQLLFSIAVAAKEKKKNISICGEMAGNPAYTELLLGLGFRSLSVRPGELLEIKNMIRSINIQQAENFAKQVLEINTVQEIKKRVNDVYCEKSKELF